MFDDFRYGNDDSGLQNYQRLDSGRDSSYRFRQSESAPTCACECASDRRRSVPNQVSPDRANRGQQFDSVPSANFSNPPRPTGENRLNDRFVPLGSFRQPSIPQLPDLRSRQQTFPRQEIASQPVIPNEMKGIAKLSLADQRAALKQRLCPVTRDLLGSMGKPHKVNVLGRTVFVCCQGCVDEIRENPREYETAVKSFTAWLERTNRLPVDPLRGFRRTHVAKNEEVRTRHAFTSDELKKIFNATLEGPIRQKWPGLQRELLYRFCMETGFRAAEAGAMRKQDFAEDLTSVHIAPWFTKSGKEADQPIPELLRPKLALFLTSLSQGEFLWPGGWKQLDDGSWSKAGWVNYKGAGRVLNADAAAAGIEIGQKAKEI